MGGLPALRVACLRVGLPGMGGLPALRVACLRVGLPGMGAGLPGMGAITQHNATARRRVGASARAATFHKNMLY